MMMVIKGEMWGMGIKQELGINHATWVHTVQRDPPELKSTFVSPKVWGQNTMQCYQVAKRGRRGPEQKK